MTADTFRTYAAQRGVYEAALLCAACRVPLPTVRQWLTIIKGE